jgi:hypothetical protein
LTPEGTAHGRACPGDGASRIRQPAADRFLVGLAGAVHAVAAGVNSDKNGYQVHQVYPGWGIGNVFTGNRAQVNGPGCGIYVQSKRLQTVVSCDNAVTTAGDGFSTLPCSSV